MIEVVCPICGKMGKYSVIHENYKLVGEDGVVGMVSHDFRSVDCGMGGSQMIPDKRCFLNIEQDERTRPDEVKRLIEEAGDRVEVSFSPYYATCPYCGKDVCECFDEGGMFYD